MKAKTRNPEEALRKALEQARQRAREGLHVILRIDGESFYVVALPLAEDVASANDNATLSKPWMADFLGWLSKGRSVQEAADLSGVTKRHTFRSYHRDLHFARAWDAIKKVTE